MEKTQNNGNHEEKGEYGWPWDTTRIPTMANHHGTPTHGGFWDFPSEGFSFRVFTILFPSILFLFDVIILFDNL